jgi:hypothetical protein
MDEEVAGKLAVHLYLPCRGRHVDTRLTKYISLFYTPVYTL